ncbi:MAG: hypothetical protein K1060chlam5_00612 [Candidatus Anoxychlamydiales bacterium]|nr:hypothetical protein [Candidatus Anoxychlamydiales bacterium]
MSKKIPKDLIKKSIDLSKWGINERAWDKKRSLELLEILLRNNYEIGVSGGDVYCLENDELKTLYENWFCDPRSNETIKEYNLRSLLEAKRYIENYNIKKNNIIFSFVFSDYLLFEDEK